MLQKLKNLIFSGSRKAFMGFLGTSLLTQVIGFLSSVFVIRELGPELRGYHAFLGLMGYFLVPIFSFGFLASLNYYIASKEYKPSEVMKSILYIAVGRGLLIFFIILLLRYFNLLGDSGNTIPYLYILMMASLFPFNLIKESLHRLLLADSKYKHANYLNIWFAIIPSVSLFIFVVFLKLELIGVAVSIIISSFISLLLTLYFTIKNYSFNWLSYSYSTKFFRDTFSYGIKGWIGDIAVTANNRLDQLFINYFLTPTQLGLYSVCANIGQIIWIVPGAARQIILNKATQLNSKDEKVSFVMKYHNSLLSFSVLLTLFFVYYSKELLGILYGTEFQEVNKVLSIYLSGTCVYVGTMIITKLFAASRKIIYNTYIQLISAFCSLILFYFLIPKFQLIGAALSSSIVYLLTYLVSMILLKKFKISK